MEFFLARFRQLRLSSKLVKPLLCFAELAHEPLGHDDEASFHWPRSRPEMDA